MTDKPRWFACVDNDGERCIIVAPCDIEYIDLGYCYEGEDENQHIWVRADGLDDDYVNGDVVVGEFWPAGLELGPGEMRELKPPPKMEATE